jgi:hypothetical protein
MVVSSKQLWAVFVTTALWFVRRLWKLMEKDFNQNLLASFNGYLQHHNSHSNRKGLISS